MLLVLVDCDGVCIELLLCFCDENGWLMVFGVFMFVVECYGLMFMIDCWVIEMVFLYFD